jgi:hypothetical protein
VTFTTKYDGVVGCTVPLVVIISTYIKSSICKACTAYYKLVKCLLYESWPMRSYMVGCGLLSLSPAMNSSYLVGRATAYIDTWTTFHYKHYPTNKRSTNRRQECR